MNERILTNMEIEKFENYLRTEEKSANTLEKYIRDVAAFSKYCETAGITKETVINYKQKLIDVGFAVRSINSMLASINNLFSFLGWHDLKVKSLKVQRQVFCPEEKELTKEEYVSLCKTAKRKHNVRLCLILQTICATGIRVSELQFITVEAVRRGEATVSLKGKTRSVFIVRNLQNKLLRYIAEHVVLSVGNQLVKKGYAQVVEQNMLTYPVVAISRPLYMVLMIVRKFGHFADIEIILLRNHGMARSLFIYTTLLVRHWLGYLVIQNVSNIYGRKNLIK